MLSETENKNALQGSAKLEEKTMLAMLSEMNSVMAQVEENLNQLENRISSLELENTDLNDKLRVMVEENETLKKEKEEVESSKEDVKKELEIEKQQKMKIGEKEKQLSRKILSLESEKTSVDQKLQDANGKLASLESEKGYWDKKLKVAKEDNGSLKKCKEELELLYKDLKRKLEEEIEQKIQLEENLDQLNSSIVSLESEKTDSDGKLKLIEEENQSLKTGKEELESLHEELMKRLEEEMQQKIQVDGNINELDSKVISLESEKLELKQKLKLLEEYNESLTKDKGELESSKKDLKEKLVVAISQKMKLEEDVNELNNQILLMESSRIETDSPINGKQEDNESFNNNQEDSELVKEGIVERHDMETQGDFQDGKRSEDQSSEQYRKSSVTSPVVTQKEKEIKKLHSELVKEKEYFAKMVEEKSKEISDYQTQLNDENQKRLDVEKDLAKGKKEVEMLKEQLNLAHGIIYSNSLSSVGGNESLDEDHPEATLSMPAGKNIKRSGWNKHAVEVTSEKIIFYETENEKTNNNKLMLEIDLDKLFDVQAVTQEDVIRAKPKHIPKIFQLLYTGDAGTGDEDNQSLNSSQSEKLKDKEIINYNNHEFVVMHFHMPASCGSCNKTLSSVIRPRPALYCTLCHLKVHKDHHDKNEEFCQPCKASTSEGSTKHLLLMASSPKEQQKWIEYLNKKILLHKMPYAESSNISSSETD